MAPRIELETPLMPRPVRTLVPPRPPALALAAAFLLAACGGAAEPAPTPVPATPPQEPVPTVRTDEEPGQIVTPTPTPTLLGVDLDTVRAGRFDQGKMWTFEHPPVEHFREAYGLEADSAWFARARLGALRIPSCSASFVSPNGLVLTNHHCARDFVSQVSAEGEDLLDRGFYATSLAEERAVEDFEADQLIAIVDVTEEVRGAVGDRTGEARTEALDEITEEIQERMVEERGGEDEGVVVEVISLYDGARYSAYVFRRYTEARLVMAPELQIGFFGGDPDNFTYPRYNLDFAFFRIYDDGEPLRTTEYFPFSADGVDEGDAVFIVGNPGATSRLQTVAELEFRREVSDISVLDFLGRRAEVLREYIDAFPAVAEEHDLRNVLFGILNSQKAYEGQIDGLRDPVILARRADTQARLQAAIEADPALSARYGGALEEMAELQEQKRELADGFKAFLALTAEGYASPTLHRALLAFQIVSARQAGAPETATAGIMEQLEAVGDLPAELDELLIEARIQDFIDVYGAEARWIQNILQGRTPEGAAAVIRDGSALTDSAAVVEAARIGMLDPNDPAIRFVGFYVPTFARFQQALAGLLEREEEVAARLGRARYEIYGTDLPPDATFSLRIADGLVEGYPYNGTVAPVLTTFYGLYDRHYSFLHSADEDDDFPWALPDRWVNPPEGLDLATPVNFVSTVDIIGGNSGSPVLNRDLEVVGVVFDGNIESLPGDYIYLPELNRSVVVDARGILAALDHAYDMDRIVVELLEGAAHPTEAAADAARR